MKKNIWKRLIIDSQEKDLSHVIPRNLAIPTEVNKIISLIGVRRGGKTYLPVQMHSSRSVAKIRNALAQYIAKVG